MRVVSGAHLRHKLQLILLNMQMFSVSFRKKKKKNYYSTGLMMNCWWSEEDLLQDDTRWRRWVWAMNSPPCFKNSWIVVLDHSSSPLTEHPKMGSIKMFDSQMVLKQIQLGICHRENSQESHWHHFQLLQKFLGVLLVPQNQISPDCRAKLPPGYTSGCSSKDFSPMNWWKTVSNLL